MSNPGRRLTQRDVQLIRAAVDKTDLDLIGLSVITEAATGNYIYTPLICAAAGCRNVLAVTRDSAYGTAAEVTRDTERAAGEMGLTGHIEVISDVADGDWGAADIVTNLGFLRPISREIIQKLKPTAAIPIMFETWEFRERDLDLAACWDRGICVLGTNEELGSIRILDYLGMLAAKKLLERGVEIQGSKIVVVGRGKFLSKVCDALGAMGALVLRWFADVDDADTATASEERLGALAGADAVIVADEPNTTAPLIGEEGVIPVDSLRRHCPGAVVVQLAGAVSRAQLSAAGIDCIPEDEPRPGHMGWSLSEIGPRPVIDLHAAGLKVGELLARARLSGLSPAEATAKALENPLCQDFSVEQKVLYGCPY